LRKVLLAFTVVVYHHKTFPQILALQFVAIFMLYSLWTRNAVEDGDIRSAMYLNEATILIATTTLISYTTLGPDASARDVITYQLILILFITFIANGLIALNKFFFSCQTWANKIAFLQKTEELNQQAVIEVKTKKDKIAKGLKVQSLHEVAEVKHKPDVSDLLESSTAHLQTNKIHN
jgi:hypothetical protein